MEQQLTVSDIEDLLVESRRHASLPVFERNAVAATVRLCLNDIDISTSLNDIEHTCHKLLLCLRVLRNLCAGGPSTCQKVLSLGILASISRLLDLIERGVVELNWQLPLVSAQVLANAATAGASCATAVWQEAFPIQLNRLAHVRSAQTQAATALCLLSCCRHVASANHTLCSPMGAPLIAALLHTQQQLQKGGLDSNENLGLLLSHLALQQDLLPLLMKSLARGQQPAGDDQGAEGSEEWWGGGVLANSAACPRARGVVAAVAAWPSPAHVALLQELALEVQAGGELVSGSGTASRCGASSMAFLVHLVGALAGESQRQPLSEGQQQLLQDTLEFMRDAAGVDDPPPPSAAPPAQQVGAPALMSQLQQAGLLPLLLSMLSALEPIQAAPLSPQHAADGAVQRSCDRHAAAHPSAPSGRDASPTGGGIGGCTTGRERGGGAESGLDSVQRVEGAGAGCGAGGAEMTPPSLAQQAQQMPRRPPYFGYRTDILSVLANASFRRPAVKAEVQRLGCVELMLSQCQADPNSPLAREWALWGVRNICEGNEKAQDAIRQLQLCEAIETEETKRLGLRVHVDECTGKLKVVRREVGKQ